MMKTIETISIPVHDQELSKSFYVDKLGFVVLFEGGTPDGGKWIQLSIPNDSTSITLVKEPIPAQTGSVKGTIISTDNIEEDFLSLRNKGIDVTPVQEFPHGKIASFSDLDGNQWVLREAPKY